MRLPKALNSATREVILVETASIAQQHYLLPAGKTCFHPAHITGNRLHLGSKESVYFDTNSNLLEAACGRSTNAVSFFRI